MDLFSFIECANRTQSLSALFELLIRGATEEGFDQVAYGALNFSEPLRLSEHSLPAVATNYSVGWRNRYFERRYYEIDPVVRRTPSFSRPFVWDYLEESLQLEAGERLVLAEGREAGLMRGISVPLFGRQGRVSVLSFASSSKSTDPVDRMARLNALACQFHVAFADIARPEDETTPRIALSLREKDCLRWTAEGKSSWDIGMILNISDNTVNFHIKNAMRKLGTTSRTVAVVKALRFSLIDLPYRSSSSMPI